MTEGRLGEGTGDKMADPRAALPLWPWTALHPATGMLLGVDDFEVLAGNPRGKHQLHNAWLHGSGVVWGLRVGRRGTWDLEISPGLALDGVGRELHLGASRCVSIKELLEAHHDPTCGNRDVVMSLVARFRACLGAPVPALADPCDVTRENQEYSRVVEGVQLDLVWGHPGDAAPIYHRLRVLLGLDIVGTDDEPGKEALVARNEVLAAPASARSSELQWQFRCMAALDAAEWSPSGGGCDPALFHTDEDGAGVVLACLHLSVRDESGCPYIVDAHPDNCCRATVVPTSVIQDLTCALAPGLMGSRNNDVGTGPQAVPDSIEWEGNGTKFSFAVTDDLLPATLTRAAVQVCSLSASGWVVEDLEHRPRYEKATKRVTVRLADRPVHRLVRVVVQGTGATPVYGADPTVPLAGVVGDDPGVTGQGRDAVLTTTNPLSEGVDQSDHHEE